MTTAKPKRTPAERAAAIASSARGYADKGETPNSPKCQCETCAPQGEPMRMIVCAICGNKRCPHASDHRNACTNSNAPGQKGSTWENYAVPGQPGPQPERHYWHVYKPGIPEPFEVTVYPAQTQESMRTEIYPGCGCIPREP